MAKLPTWDDVKKVADDLEKRVQDAGATMRDKWNTQMKPKLAEVQKKIEATGHRAGEAVQQQVYTISEALKQFQSEIAADLKIGKKPDEAAKPEEAKPEKDADEPKPT